MGFLNISFFPFSLSTHLVVTANHFCTKNNIAYQQFLMAKLYVSNARFPCQRPTKSLPTKRRKKTRLFHSSFLSHTSCLEHATLLLSLYPHTVQTFLVNAARCKNNNQTFVWQIKGESKRTPFDHCTLPVCPWFKHTKTHTPALSSPVCLSVGSVGLHQHTHRTKQQPAIRQAGRPSHAYTHLLHWVKAIELGLSQGGPHRRRQAVFSSRTAASKQQYGCVRVYLRTRPSSSIPSSSYRTNVSSERRKV